VEQNALRANLGCGKLRSEFFMIEKISEEKYVDVEDAWALAEDFLLLRTSFDFAD